MADYSFDEERRSVRINFLGSLSGASVEDYEEAMAKVIDVLLEVKKAERIVLAKEREYEYAGEQAAMLSEIAGVLEGVLRERVVSAKSLGGENCRFYYPTWNARLQYIVFQLLRKDPIGAYVEVVRELRDARLRIKNAATSKEAACFTAYKENVLDTLRLRLEQTQLIKAVKPSLAGYHIGDRALYRQLFMPAVRPNFMFTRYMVAPPEGGISVDRYKVGDIDVEIFKMPHAAEYFYHVTPPEFKLSDARYGVLDQARVYMATHQPKSAEFVRSGKVREMFVAIGRDMIREMAERKAVKLSPQEVEQLAGILARYTAGLGVLEILLADEKIQDVYVNSPIEQQPIRVFHADWEECKTNLIPTHEDAEAWATRLRILSGRPLDEANPVLDTDILVPGGSARFAVITKTLSPLGLGFAIRRHRDKPWTLPLFIKTKMINPLAAGLLSFLIDGTVSILVAGGRGAGKTSVLSGLMLEILPKTRIVTIEDSVTGDCELMYEKAGKLHRGEIGKVVDAMVAAHGGGYFGHDVAPNPEGIRVFSMDREGKIRLSPVSKFIRHRVEKPIYEVETRTGHKIRVTGDHSLFTLSDEGRIAEVKTGDLKEGSFLAVPRRLDFGGGIESIDLVENLGKMPGAYVFGPAVKAAVWHSWETVKRVGKEFGRPKPSIQWWRRGILPAAVFLRLREEGVAFEKHGLQVRYKAGAKALPASLPLDKDFLTLMGLWLADGSYDVNSTIISVQEEGARAVVKRFAERYGLGWKMHSDRFSLMINSRALKAVLKDVLGLSGDSFTKRPPAWTFGLSKEQVGWLLCGLFSGDGHASDKEVVLSLRSEKMVKDAQTLLLRLGVVSTVRENSGFFALRIGAVKFLKAFREQVGFCVEHKQDRLEQLCRRVSTHDTLDVIPLSDGAKQAVAGAVEGFNQHDYLSRGFAIGREKLGNMVTGASPGAAALMARTLVETDLLWDEVRSVKPVSGYEYVYDLSVPGDESFVCENIVAHNTQELPVDQMRDLDYNIIGMKSRSVITRVETEMPADEALRTALRLGDSALIVGEVRSVEARALYEAMRIGALSNVVAGTIHGESAYGVFDRVVNDLGVPPTSFKATDIIPICKMLRSADGLHRFRRMTEITEIRKDWDTDPAKENGFVNLMEYSSKTDELKPTDTLIHGESAVLTRIAGLVKEWSGDWNAVWENIQLRAKIKQATVSLAEQAQKPELLEGEWVVRSNQAFHLIAEAVRKEVGSADAGRIYPLWQEWFKRAAKL